MYLVGRELAKNKHGKEKRNAILKNKIWLIEWLLYLYVLIWVSILKMSS